MTVVGLFAGIGGLEKGFSEHGFHASLLSEIDPNASAVLKSRFPEARITGDVSKLSNLPNGTKIVTAGFPCQNLSMAGDKRGIDGTKSGIVSELFRLIENSRVQTIVIENVYFMLQLDRGRGMDRLVSRLEELGYSWAYRVLDTSGFGLPHRRRRVYLVASRDLDPCCVLFADEAEQATSNELNLEKPLGFYWTEGRSGVGLTIDGIPPLKGGSGLGIPSAPAVLFNDGEVLMPSLSACEGLQGFEVGWTAAACVNGEKNPRWRLLGNAVSVPVASWVASRIRNPGDALALDTFALKEGRWPDAGFNVGRGRMGVKASHKPILIPTKSIVDFRNDSWLMLSDRALNGFLGRAKEGGLRFPKGFLEALHQAGRR